MKAKFIFLLIVYFSSFSFSQLITDSYNLTNMSKVRAAMENAEGIWAATTGGAYFYIQNENSFDKFTKSNGLNGAAITAIAVDKQGKIWFGSSNGVIDVYNPSNKSFKRILDIYYSDRTQKQINFIEITGDSILVSTDFGLSIVDSKSYIFKDTYFKFGNLSSNIKVNHSIYFNKFYVSTNLGLAVQKDGAVNLSAPDSWEVMNTATGLPSNVIRRVFQFNDTIFAATERGFVFLDGNNWITHPSLLSNKIIKDVFPFGNNLIILEERKITNAPSEYSVHRYANGEIITLTTSVRNINSLISFNSSTIKLATEQGIGFLSLDGNIYYVSPNGPASNFFPSMKTDSKGNLWSASGNDVAGVGFYKWNRKEWKNFSSQSSGLSTNAFFSAFVARNDNVYMGSFGGGFVRIKNDSLIQTFYVDNTDLVGIRNNPNYLVISDFAEDSKNNIWILNYESANKKTLSVITPDSNWFHFDNKIDENQIVFTKMLIDQYDTKWFVSTNPSRPALYYFNEMGTLSNLNDDRNGMLTTTNGLNSNTIFSLALDKRGDLWIGTSLGVNVITNVSSVVSSSSTPQFRISSVFSLRQHSINALAVDALNQKWVGTNQGLLVVSPDGSSLIASFNASNSVLLSDVIKSITIDETNGIVYVGTDEGLTVFNTTSLAPLQSFSELFVYPNPLKIQNGKEVRLTIDGLIKDSEIKILSVSGKVIRQISTPGGRIAFWDGKDDNGKFVNSGVYIIAAYDKEGNNVTTQKVAVINK